MLLKEVMEKSGLSRKAVQYYEDQGFVKPVKLENGYRDYDEDCLKTLRDIHAMRQMGLHTNEMCPYVYIRKPSLLLGVIQCMLGATGFLLFPWLPGTTNLWLIALLLVFILQLIQNMYYDTRIHGLQYMEIGWKQLGLTAVLAFICGILTAISCKEAYMQQSGAVFCITAVTAILQLWSGFHHLPARQAVGFCECRHYIGKHIHLITQRRCSCKQTDAVPVNGENIFRIKNVKFQKKC